MWQAGRGSLALVATIVLAGGLAGATLAARPPSPSERRAILAGAEPVFARVTAACGRTVVRVSTVDSAYASVSVRWRKPAGKTCKILPFSGTDLVARRAGRWQFLVNDASGSVRCDYLKRQRVPRAVSRELLGARC